MDERGTFLASLLDASRRAYAAGAVNRLEEGGDAGRRALEAWSFSDLVADTEVRLRHLAEALATGQPDIFALDAAWLASGLAARGIDPALLAVRLRCLRNELVEGLPPEGREPVEVCVERALARVETELAPVPSLLEEEAPHAELARRFLLAVLEGRRRDALDLVLKASEDGVAVGEIHRDVIARAQRELGRMWQMGEVHVGEEHLGSRVVEEALVLLNARAPRAAETGRSVLIASVPGNLHDIGPRMVADRFDMAGWRSLFLGADVPAEDVVLALRDFGADVLALSLGMAWNARAAAGLVAEVRREHPGLPILVGGGVLAELPDLGGSLGADATALDPDEAVRTAERLVGARA